MTTVAIGSDHAGFALKQALGEWMRSRGYEVVDVGAFDDERSDYPVYGAKVAREVASGAADTGVAVCGSGEGICMAVNKIDGIRGGVVRTLWDAEMIRRHNDANVACFGERATSIEDAIPMLEVFLTTEFEGGRHADRVALIHELEKPGSQG